MTPKEEADQIYYEIIMELDISENVLELTFEVECNPRLVRPFLEGLPGILDCFISWPGDPFILVLYDALGEIAAKEGLPPGGHRRRERELKTFAEAAFRRFRENRRPFAAPRFRRTKEKQ